MPDALVGAGAGAADGTAENLALSQYHVSHGAACFATLEDAVERKREVATLAPGSALLILERATGADGLEYAQFAARSQFAVTEAGAQSVLWSLDSPFIKHLDTKGRRDGAATMLQAAWAAQMGHRRARTIAQGMQEFFMEGADWESAVRHMQREFRLWKSRRLNGRGQPSRRLFEWQKVVCLWQKLLFDALQKFDVDQNGFIDAGEFKMYLQAVGAWNSEPAFTDERWARSFPRICQMLGAADPTRGMSLAECPRPPGADKRS
jgi:hypothetical protein